MSALTCRGANPEDLSQASLNLRALLSLSGGDELCPFVGTFACCSGRAFLQLWSCVWGALWKAAKGRDTTSALTDSKCPWQEGIWVWSYNWIHTFPAVKRILWGCM